MTKAVLKGKCIVTNAYIKKKENMNKHEHRESIITKRENEKGVIKGDFPQGI